MLPPAGSPPRRRPGRLRPSRRAGARPARTAPCRGEGTGTIAELVRAHGHDWAVMRAVFAFEASYGTRAAGSFTVAASTNPLREGQALLGIDDFSYAEAQGLVTQHTRAEDGHAD